ncbi:MAG: DinB family protein [Acidobacteriales bacterium]|nr:DinB family protein [Terriglobales bacterium]
MNQIRWLQRLFAYDAWANDEVLNALSTASVPDAALRLLNHLFSAQKLWLERLQQLPPSLAVWPDLSVSQCQELNRAMRVAWKNHLAALDDSELSAACSYTNSKGEHFTSETGDILMHVIVHSAYHRGQIASRMRDAGVTPPLTDYIHGVRQGLVE